MDAAETLDALMSLPTLEHLLVSRDGRWVAWSWFRTGPAGDVYAAPTDGSAPPTRLTCTSDDTYVVSWAPDSRAVVVEQDRDGNERVQLYRVDLDRPGEMMPLTEPEPNHFIRGGDLHPNGRWLVYGANVDPSTGREIEPTWIIRHDLETGERRVLARPQQGAYIRPLLNPTGSHVLYQRADLHPAGRQVWLVDIEGRQDREILNFGAPVKTSASWFPDGQRALVLTETETHRRVGVWDLASGALRWLFDDPRRNIEEAAVPYGSDQVVLIEVRRARPHTSLLDPQSGTEIPLPPFPGNLLLRAPVGLGEWVALWSSSRQPAEVVRLSLADPRPEAFRGISQVWTRTSLTPADLTPAEEFCWSSPDGQEIHGWLYRAAEPARGTIVTVHGGPSYHSPDAIDPQIQFLTRAGYHVLDPNYRGSTGYGLPFREAIKEDGWGGREQEDIRAGIEALIAAGIAQPGKVGITGTSYGGYSSWCAITRWPPDVVAAAAPICGMTDLVVDYETTRPDLRPFSAEMMGGRPDQVPERFRERSPIHHVGNIRGRLLIVQGLQDPNVTPENVRVVRHALEQAGVPYQILTFEDEGHGITRPANEKQLYIQLEQFFAQSFASADV